MFEFLFTRKPQTEQLLALLQGHDWVSTESMMKAGIKDYKSIKYLLKKQGYIFDRKNEKPHKKSPPGSHYKTYYKLVGRVPGLGGITEKRDYLRKFTDEDLIHDLWRRDRLSQIMVNDNLYQVVVEVQKKDI